MLARYDQTFRWTGREKAEAPDGLEAARQELVALTNGSARRPARPHWRRTRP